MTGRSLFGAGGVLIAVVAVAAALGAWRSWDDEPPQTVDEPIVGSAVVEPEQHLFADAVRARLDLIVDPERVDPGSVEVGANFAPYRQLRPVRVAREDRGSLVRLRYEYVLGCLAARCLPTGTGRVELGAAAVEYTRRGSPVPDTAEVQWPPLRAAGRIAPAELGRAAMRADLRGLPERTYRVSPRTVEIVALVLAVLFGVAAAALLLRLLPLERLAARLGARRVDRRTALERALAHVRHSTAVGDPDEGRRALERLAAELRRTRNPALARDASKLAWSRGAPAEAGVAPLSAEVERLISEDGDR